MSQVRGKSLGLFEFQKFGYRAFSILHLEVGRPFIPGFSLPSTQRVNKIGCQSPQCPPPREERAKGREGLGSAAWQAPSSLECARGLPGRPGAEDELKVLHS